MDYILEISSEQKVLEDAKHCEDLQLGYEMTDLWTRLTGMYTNVWLYLKLPV